MFDPLNGCLFLLNSFCCLCILSIQNRDTFNVQLINGTGNLFERGDSLINATKSVKRIPNLLNGSMNNNMTHIWLI